MFNANRCLSVGSRRQQVSELLPEQQNEALHCQNGSSASFGSGQGRSVTTRLGQAAPADLTLYALCHVHV